MGYRGVGRDDIQYDGNVGTVATPVRPTHFVTKSYVDDQFPVTHASTTGQTTDDHHVEFTTTEHTAIGDGAPHHVKAVSGDIDHDATVNTHNLTTDIDHTTIQNIGSNSHAVIDTHIGDSTDPHGATLGQTNLQVDHIAEKTTDHRIFFDNEIAQQIYPPDTSGYSYGIQQVNYLSPTSDGNGITYGLNFSSYLITDYNHLAIVGAGGGAGINAGAGTPILSIAYCFDGQISCSCGSGGKIGETACLHASSPSISTNGHIDDNYGLWISNQKNAKIDNSWAIYTNNGLCHFGDDVDIVGDLTFTTNGGGLPYGCLDGTDETITCTTQNTWYQVTFDTAGASNNTTPSTANNDIVIDKTGDYKIGVTACFHIANAQDVEIMVKKENGTVDLSPHLFQTAAVASQVENTAGSCIVPITATDTLELWVRCTSAGAIDVIFDHVDLNCVQVGV